MTHLPLDNPRSETAPQRPRCMGLDALRVLAALAVVAVHATGDLLFQEPAFSNAWWAGAVYGSLVRWCVPAFLMLSGAFLLSPERREPAAAFYRRAGSKLMLPTIFWSVFFFFALQARKGDDAPTLVEFLLLGHTHLWYLYVLVGLYAAVPALRKLVAALSDREMLFLLVIGFVTGGLYNIQQLWISGRAGYSIAEWPLYVPYLLLGHYMMTHVSRVHVGRSPTPSSLGRSGTPSYMARNTSYLLLFALSCLLLLLTLAACAPLGEVGICMAQCYMNPLVVACAIGIFGYFATLDDRCRWAALLAKAAPCALGVYCVHPVAITACKQAGLDAPGLSPWLGGLLLTFAVFLLSLAAVIVLRRLPVLRRVV
jgi:surface polysaccharide O-acyltransferase-like enzyme